MLGLTSLGVIHTAISLVAVGAGVAGLVRDHRIDLGNGAGKTYLVMTVLTCLTGFGIFQHGGFGKPHALGVLTLLVLLAAWLVRRRVAVHTVLLSLTLFFHMIPAVTETLTRLPLGAPVLANAEAPELKAITGVMFVLFVIGAALQVRSLNQGRKPARKAAAA
ncbi:hypothetical protein SAMN05428959_102151 [Duganella sp. CF517]|uniref:hypothetical protein n=1 Tax=Duganella sp. CF517 TaxID=1881038 RepID=UPI0008D4E815|nr:hypothetical protein [Duganella sp. CF517]SEN49956.1 hypothetical protein SAMN05428959_102151 [Duganella sp. CF517]